MYPIGHEEQLKMTTKGIILWKTITQYRFRLILEAVQEGLFKGM